jgi:hypothetical protein
MAIKRRPLKSYAIANNLLTPSIKAINIRISPQTTTPIAWNNFQNFEDTSSGMKHLERCSYTIPKNSPKNKWGVMVKAWENKILSGTKVCQFDSKK